MQLHTGSESKVQTHMREDCDINNILNKYQKTGVLPHLIKQQPEYGDFSSPLEFQESLNLILKAQEQFEALPARTRERFGNEPGAFLQFATDPSNKEEMAKLGPLSEDAMAALREPKPPPYQPMPPKRKKGKSQRRAMSESWQEAKLRVLRNKLKQLKIEKQIQRLEKKISKETPRQNAVKVKKPR